MNNSFFKCHQILLIFTLAFSSNLSYGAKFYKWTDEDGNIHYSDVVPDGTENQETIRVNSRAPSGAAASKAKLNKQRQDKQEANKAAQDAQAELAKTEEDKKIMAEYCAGLKRNISLLEQGGRVKTVDDSGEQRFVTDEEHAEKLKKYRGELDKKC